MASTVTTYGMGIARQTAGQSFWRAAAHVETLDGTPLRVREGRADGRSNPQRVRAGRRSSAAS